MSQTRRYYGPNNKRALRSVAAKSLNVLPADPKYMTAQEKAELPPYLLNFENTMDSISAAHSESEANVAEEEADTEGITYFVDDEGRYYYQPAGESQNIIPITAPEAESVEGDADNQMLVDGEGYQTVTLVPSDPNTGEVSYVLVVQDESKGVNIDIKVDQQEKGNDVYNFNEEEEDDEGDEIITDDESLAKLNKKGKRYIKRNGKVVVRPKFTCNFCSYNSHRRYLLLRHMKSHSEERPHKCQVCERGFKTVSSLQNHVNMHNGVKPHICKYCNSPFTTSGELVRHVRYKHTHEKPHKCSECDYASVELSKLRRHVRCHTGERPYQCPHCTYASPDTFKLKRHLRTHTGEKPYKCDSCNMCFTQSNSLKAHKLIHNVSEKPVYACELCPAKCGRKTDLRIHVQKLHTSEKPLKCKRCGKTFPDRYSCKMHNKTHEGEKCFKCELCPYASTTYRHLKSHMLKHTDEKPFVCDQCDQSFRQKQLLRRHQNIYHNPDYVPKPPKEKTHTCHECGRTFAHKGNLIRHLAVHDPDSGHHERALALKLGRQKKITPEGQIKEPMMQSMDDEETEDEDDLRLDEQLEEDLKTGEVVTVGEGEDQQYVVLEVIQLEDGTERQITVVAPSYAPEEEQPEEDETYEIFNDNEPLLLNKAQGNRNRAGNSVKVEKDVDTYFGFDDDEEQDEAGDMGYNDKVHMSPDQNIFYDKDQGIGKTIDVYEGEPESPMTLQFDQNNSEEQVPKTYSKPNSCTKKGGDETVPVEFEKHFEGTPAGIYKVGDGEALPIEYEKDGEESLPMEYENNNEEISSAVYETASGETMSIEYEKNNDEVSAVVYQTNDKEVSPVVYETRSGEALSIEYEKDCEEVLPVVYETAVEELPVVYETAVEELPVVYETNAGETLPIEYEKENENDDLAEDKFFSPTLEAIADLPNDSLLTLVTIISEDDVANGVPLYDDAKESEMMEIPEEGENVTFIEKNSENLPIAKEEDGVYAAEKIVLQLG